MYVNISHETRKDSWSEGKDLKGKLRIASKRTNVIRKHRDKYLEE